MESNYLIVFLLLQLLKFLWYFNNDINIFVSLKDSLGLCGNINEPMRILKIVIDCKIFFSRFLCFLLNSGGGGTIQGILGLFRI